MNLESATLVLRTSSINTSKGDIDVSNYHNDVTWNIDLQQCLGNNMFNKYKRFKLCLTSVGAGTPPTTLSDTNRCLMVNVEGLPWQNQSYNSVTNTIDRNVIMSSIQCGTTSGFSTNFVGEVGCIFNRPSSNNMKVRIYLTKISDSTITQIQYPNFVYCFSIYGIDE